MKLLRNRVALLVLCLCASSVTHAEPTTDEREDAAEHFMRGVEHHDNGDYRAALIEFKQAYRIAPIYQLLYNLGQESVELRNYVEAHTHFHNYLRDGGDDIGAERREAVLLEISRIAKYLSEITLTATVDGAEVALDGVVVGVTPLDAIRVSVGRHRVVITLPGYATWDRVVDVAGGEERVVAANLISQEAVIGTPQTVDSRVKSPGRSSAFWVSAGTTTAAVIGTGVMLLLTNNAKNDYEAELNSEAVTSEAKLLAIRDTGDSYKRMALFTDIGLGLSLAGVVTTFFLAGSNETRPTNPKVGMHFGPGSMAISGQF